MLAQYFVFNNGVRRFVRSNWYYVQQIKAQAHVSMVEIKANAHVFNYKIVGKK